MLSNIILLVHLFGLSTAADWIINGNFQYLLNSKDKVIWDTAVKNCKNEGAELLLLTSQSETEFITSNCPKCRYWLNLGRDSKDPNKFIWMDDKVLDTKVVNWASKEPRTGDCVELDSGLLYTMACDDVNGYVCKKKYIPPTTAAPEPDPCNKYMEMSDDGSRASQNDIQPTLLHCDEKLKTGWYRLISASGNTIPTSCVPPLRCGTLEPVWMQGTLPTTSDGIVLRKACVSSGVNCCAKSWDIRVKKCSNYYVYFLKPVDQCFRAYCIGITKPQCTDCDNGKFPTVIELPTLTWRIVNAKIEFVCDIIYKLTTTYQFYFEVQWFADKEKIHQLILGGNKLQAILEQKYLIGKLGKTITVQIRGRFGDGPWSPFKISTGFFAGIKITTSSAITIKPGGDLGKISFQLTLPLICPVGVQNCAIKLFTGLVITGSESTCSNQNKIDEAVIKCPTNDINNAFCGIIITNENWNQVHEISIAGTIHSQLTAIKTCILKLFTLESTFELWGKIDININIQITIVGLNIVNNICSSLNDPHMRTFDNMNFEHHLRGTFVLYRNKRNGFEVQAFYERCPGAPTLTCNCAVAVLSSDLLILIDRCGNKGNMDPIGYPLERSAKVRAITIQTLKANQKGTLVYRLEQGRKYQIIFPTGTYVEVTQSYSWLINIAIRASVADISVTEGLCGTFNGNIRDDFTLRDGSVACNPGKICARFSKNWEVSANKGGLFKKVISTMSIYKEEIFCRCKLRNGKLPEKSCDYNNNIQICQTASKGKDITSFLKQLGIIRKRSINHDYVDDNELDDDWELRYLKKRRKREAEEKIDVLSNVKPWTEEGAKNHCINSLQKSSAGKYCNAVPNVEFDSKVDFCISDIMMSNSTEYVPTAIEAVKEECSVELNRNSSLWVASKDPNTGEDIFIPPPDIEGQMCINDCSNHGSCQKGLCKCLAGFAGGDCSIRSDQAPEVYYIPQGGLCDKKNRQCWTTAVNGLNFIESDQLTCHLEPVSVNMPNKGYNLKGLPPTTVKGFFESFGEIRCPIPITAVNVIDSWLISVSNDGKLKSKDSALFTAYNSDCINCQAEGLCIQKENTCAIRGKCFQAGESNPKTTCEKCKPMNSINQWTPDPECSSGQPVTFPSTTNPILTSTTISPIITSTTISAIITSTIKKPIFPVTMSPMEFICPTSSGIYPHPRLCSHYVICKDSIAVSVPCENGLVFNPKRQICDIPESVLVCINGKWA